MGNVKVGKFIDDETGEALNDVEGILGKVGVKLRDDADNFRNFGEVLDEVGSKWSTYSEVEQSAIAGAIAGKQMSHARTYSNIWIKHVKKFLEGNHIGKTLVIDNSEIRLIII